MKQSVISKIVAFILGNKYYANIINTRGTNKCELCCFIFNTREQADAHRLSVDDATKSFMHVETISFRSRNKYICCYPDASVAK